MHELGKKIVFFNSTLEENWKRWEKLNENMPKSLRLFGRFLIQILDDREKGEFLINAYNKKKKLKTINFNSLLGLFVLIF